MTTYTDSFKLFSALEKWIKQRSKLDPANYGLGCGQGFSRGQWRDAYRAYQSEVRSISAQGRRAKLALAQARTLEPYKPELMEDAFKGFSGRLEWDGESLSYTTGQYWPTEYRVAAAVVLERYVAEWLQWNNRINPKQFTYQTISDVKEANRSIGHHWFDRSTMRFFNTRIESPLIAGQYFVTSEEGPDNIRKYSVRRAESDGTVDTIGEFQQYRSKSDAREAIRELLKGGAQ